MNENLKPTGDVTPAERERLGKLTEEMGEVQQVIGKILVHGFVAVDFDGTVYDNRRDLEKELGDVGAAIRLMAVAEDVDPRKILKRADKKGQTMTDRMRHQADEVIANFKANKYR